MKIVLCGSMTASREMCDLEKRLVELGHQPILPEFTREYAQLDSQEDMHSESVVNKVKHDLIRKYFEVIKQGDSLLVVNVDRRGIPGYIGGNTLIEMALAHVLNKPVYLFNGIPDMPYRDEIKALTTQVLNRDLKKIK